MGAWRVCVHTGMQIRYSRFSPFHLSLQRDFATMARKPNYIKFECWLEAFVCHKGDIRRWSWRKGPDEFYLLLTSLIFHLCPRESESKRPKLQCHPGKSVYKIAMYEFGVSLRAPAWGYFHCVRIQTHIISKLCQNICETVPCLLDTAKDFELWLLGAY